ncbi:adenine phosphoribosyltransferase [Gordonia desulfuricans]|uniref:Adenine phosphoribosyltransferase n=1 Tax=Gordonia desulfuricans TaxID=89051 RepID=A0A7K3LWV1_9ACTN|nr:MULTISPECIES: adenine phosphoribosyltransferase [Gordonia]KOY49935.1 adenine phosphoribosyltransferase [Gordonia sp. NB41Y]NDK92037.1 adenine phosphoribosyltransferase [Gordonia desulfuricans]WLP92944.1 adenine phosphoribosyltransferase [Gordonia sp. NB41Y]
MVAHDVTADALARARAAIADRARRVADFPKPGIAFKDLTPVLADPEGLSAIVTALTHGCSRVDLVAGIDARGFLLGGAVARELQVGVLAVRKGGKLPPPVIAIDYQLEYGTARLEIPADGIELVGRRVLVVDDVLATGGTSVAAARLLEQAGAEVIGFAVIMELAGLGGRETIAAGLGDVPVHSVTLD